VNALYGDLLSRAADASGMTGWEGLLQGGTSMSSIAMSIATSPERYMKLTQGYYQEYLGRTAGAGELSAWVGVWQQGVTDTQIQAGFLSSQEYLQKQGNSAVNWIVSTYQKVLGHSPDQNGINSWLGVLDA
jgi:hypothetical protein